MDVDRMMPPAHGSRVPVGPSKYGNSSKDRHKHDSKHKHRKHKHKEHKRRHGDDVEVQERKFPVVEVMEEARADSIESGEIRDEPKPDVGEVNQVEVGSGEVNSGLSSSSCSMDGTETSQAGEVEELEMKQEDSRDVKGLSALPGAGKSTVAAMNLEIDDLMDDFVDISQVLQEGWEGRKRPNGESAAVLEKMPSQSSHTLAKHDQGQSQIAQIEKKDGARSSRLEGTERSKSRREDTADRPPADGSKRSRDRDKPPRGGNTENGLRGEKHNLNGRRETETDVKGRASDSGYRDRSIDRDGRSHSLSRYQDRGPSSRDVRDISKPERRSPGGGRDRSLDKRRPEDSRERSKRENSRERSRREDSRERSRRGSSRDRARDGERRGEVRERRESGDSKRSRPRDDHYKSSRSSKRSKGDDGVALERPGDDGDEEMVIDVDPEMVLQNKEEEEEQRLIELRRQRMQAIKERHQQEVLTQPPASPSTPKGDDDVVESAPQPAEHPLSPASQAPTLPAAGQDMPPPSTPPGLGAWVPDDGSSTPEGDRTSSSDSEGRGDGPVLDIFNKGEDDFPAGGEATSQVNPAEPNLQSERLRAPVHVTKEDDMFADPPEDDMFADVPEGAQEVAEEAPEDDMFSESGAGAGTRNRRGPTARALAHDACDDKEGYYNFQVNEVMDNRYELFDHKGKGVFSTVVRARDLLRQEEDGRHPEVAIKLIRANETMYKAAQMEISILKRLGAADPENRRHCVKLLRSFEYRHHMCLVFEPMDMNLRELTNKYGRNVGLSINAVGLYGCQLLCALRHLKKCQVLHADIKPDNILVNVKRTKVKLCDFGSAMLAGDNEITPYLVSRFYRSPEVVLGHKYDYAMDMWGLGCVLYELFTGKILFPGKSNNEMLKLMMDIKGAFPKKMLRRAAFAEKHFENDPNMSFTLYEEDPVTKTPVRRIIANPTARTNLANMLTPGVPSTDRPKVVALADLLEKMLTLDPEKRIDPDSALKHPFIKEHLPKHRHK